MDPNSYSMDSTLPISQISQDSLEIPDTPPKEPKDTDDPKIETKEPEVVEIKDETDIPNEDSKKRLRRSMKKKERELGTYGFK